MTTARIFAAFLAVAFCSITSADGPPKIVEPGPAKAKQPCDDGQCKDGKCPVGAPCSSGQCGTAIKYRTGYLLTPDSPPPPVVAVKVAGQPVRNVCRASACAVETKRETLRFRLQHRVHFRRR